MARGLNAAIWVLAVALAFSVLGGLGYYSQGVAMDAGMDSDVSTVERQLGDQESRNTGGDSDFLSQTAGATDSITSAFWLLITNTAAVLQVFGIPPAIANALQTLARITFGVFIVLVMIRGVSDS